MQIRNSNLPLSMTKSIDDYVLSNMSLNIYTLLNASSLFREPHSLLGDTEGILYSPWEGPYFRPNRHFTLSVGKKSVHFDRIQTHTTMSGAPDFF